MSAKTNNLSQRKYEEIGKVLYFYLKILFLCPFSNKKWHSGIKFSKKRPG